MDLHHRIELMEGVAWKFLRTAHFFEHVSTHPSGDRFWTFVQNSLGESACLHWSHLFGNRKQEKLHLIHLTGMPELQALGPEFSHENILNRLRVRAGLDKAAYEALWDQVSICRNKYIAHKDTDSDPIIFPQLDLCVLVAEELRCVLSDCVNAILLQTPDNKELKGLARFYRGQDNALIKRGSELQFITGLRTGATWAEKYVSTLWRGGPGSNAHRA